MKRCMTRSHKGFTLLEILLVVAIISILAGIVIVAINPARQLGSTRDAQRKSDIGTIYKAVNQYLIDKGTPPLSITSTLTPICILGQTSSCVDLSVLVPTYIPEIPKDPNSTTTTGYAIAKINGNVYVEAPCTEIGFTNQAGYSTTTPTDAFVGQLPPGYSPVAASGNCSAGMSGSSQTGGSQQENGSYALQLDGLQNYLALPSMSQFSGTNWTIEFWFKTTLNDTNMVISSDTDDSIRMGLKDQHPYFEFSFNAYDNSGNSHTYGTSYSGLAYNDGNWHHLAVSSDGTTARFFIDGQVQQEWDGSFSKRVDPHGFKIAFQQMVGNVAPSTIDNLRISNTARYTSNFTPATSFTSDSNTVALYRFNTGSGTTVSDNSSHGYTGILQGSPLPSWVAGE